MSTSKNEPFSSIHSPIPSDYPQPSSVSGCRTIFSSASDRPVGSSSEPDAPTTSRTSASPVALLTGAGSGIGRAIACELLTLGYEVFGISRTFPDEKMPDTFHPIRQDLTKTDELCELIRRLKKKYTLSLLINNAGVGYFGPHEELNPSKIHELTTVNLEVPMLLTNLLLRDLKQTHGTVINISSVTALKSSPHGCAYGATKAALTAFTESLFDETRKYGVRACVLHPDMTRSNFYRNADFTTDADTETYLIPQTVADAVRFILTAPPGCVPTSLTLQPQKHRIARKSPR